MDIHPLAYSVNDARQMLGGISRSKIYLMVSARELDLRKLGGRSVITAESIKRCLEMAEAA